MLLALGLWAEAGRAELAAARHDAATVADARLVADGLARWARDTLAGPGAAWRRALLATCEAERARVDGEAGPERWLAAVAAWEQASHPYPLAMARWRAAAALLARRGDRRDRDLAAELLRQGHATAVELGAVPLRAELERLARLGRVELDTGDGQAPAQGTDEAGPADALGLTPRELEVLALVAEGRSNRQIGDALFISAKTASVHVSNILAKLEVASRVEAAAVAHRLGLLDQRPERRRPGRRRGQPRRPRRPPGSAPAGSRSHLRPRHRRRPCGSRSGPGRARAAGRRRPATSCCMYAFGIASDGGTLPDGGRFPSSARVCRTSPAPGAGRHRPGRSRRATLPGSGGRRLPDPLGREAP
jgi:DNA-binding CsgD family transcriptional regulator